MQTIHTSFTPFTPPIKVDGRVRDDALLALTARRLSAQRESAEGREGISAFLAKRKPAWAQ